MELERIVRQSRDEIGVRKDSTEGGLERPARQDCNDLCLGEPWLWIVPVGSILRSNPFLLPSICSGVWSCGPGHLGDGVELRGVVGNLEMEAHLSPTTAVVEVLLPLSRAMFKLEASSSQLLRC